MDVRYELVGTNGKPIKEGTLRQGKDHASRVKSVRFEARGNIIRESVLVVTLEVGR